MEDGEIELDETNVKWSCCHSFYRFTFFFAGGRSEEGAEEESLLSSSLCFLFSLLLLHEASNYRSVTFIDGADGIRYYLFPCSDTCIVIQVTAFVPHSSFLTFFFCSAVISASHEPCSFD